MKALEEFGVSVKPQFIELDARVLRPPVVVFGQGTEPYGPRNGRWNLRGKKFFQPAIINGYGLFFLGGPNGPRVDERGIDTFTKVCGQQFANYGIAVNPKSYPQWTLSNPHGDLERMIGEMISKLQNANGMRPNLLIFVLSAQATEPYVTIKNICDTVFGIASQCMVLEKCFNGKGQMQYLGNIALKVNIKLGGTNSMIEDPLLGKQPTMLMGCDASHPHAAQRRLVPPPPTFTAVSASYDRTCSKYSAVTNSQPAGQQMVDNFGPMAKELIKRFTEHNNREPSSIIFFRGGLSESDFVTFLGTEVDELKSELSR